MALIGAQRVALGLHLAEQAVEADGPHHNLLDGGLPGVGFRQRLDGAQADVHPAQFALQAGQRELLGLGRPAGRRLAVEEVRRLHQSAELQEQAVQGLAGEVLHGPAGIARTDFCASCQAASNSRAASGYFAAGVPSGLPEVLRNSAVSLPRSATECSIRLASAADTAVSAGVAVRPPTRSGMSYTVSRQRTLSVSLPAASLSRMVFLAASYWSRGRSTPPGRSR